ncbi:MAG: hypothetical protein WBG76_15565 [Ornithinimicrobium sp.]
MSIVLFACHLLPQRNQLVDRYGCVGERPSHIGKHFGNFLDGLPAVGASVTHRDLGVVALEFVENRLLPDGPEYCAVGQAEQQVAYRPGDEQVRI